MPANKDSPSQAALLHILPAPGGVRSYRKLLAQSRAARTLVLLVTGLAVTVSAATAWDLWTHYSDLYRDRLQTLTLLNNSFAEQVERDIQAADLALQSAELVLLGADGERYRSGRDGNDLFRAYKAGLPYLYNIGFADRNGTILTSSRDPEALRASNPTLVGVPVTNVSGLELFSYSKAHPQSGLHISAPVISRLTGRWNIGLSRPVNDAAGFIGVVGAVVEVEYLMDRQRVQIPLEGSASSIFRSDGLMMARYPAAYQLMGKDFSDAEFFRDVLKRGQQGTYRTFSKVDGLERTFVYKVLQSYPLIVNVSLDERALFAPWFASARIEIGCALAGLFIMGLLTLLILRQMRSAMELQALQETILRAQSNAGEAMVIQKEEQVVYANDAVARLLGCSTEELASLKSIRDLMHPDEIDDITERRLRREAGQPVESNYRTAVRTRDGRRVEVEVVVAEMDIDGVMHTVAIGRDITERLRTENEIRVLNLELEERVRDRTAELESANRELETFNYSVSHDLSGPARRIAGFSTLVLSNYADTLAEPVREYLGRIASGARRMGELIDDLLTLSRVSRMVIRATSVDLSDIARGIADDLLLSAPERMAVFTIQDGVTARGDARLLRIVIENLIGNAWKYTAKREAAEIEFGCGAGADGAREFFVRDNGAGFDMEHAQKLFEPFERLHSASEFEGSGIGLATVHRVISRHRGRVWAKSSSGEGATFTFTLGA